jgi:hypothetical protein
VQRSRQIAGYYRQSTAQWEAVTLQRVHDMQPEEDFFPDAAKEDDV